MRGVSHYLRQIAAREYSQARISRSTANFSPAATPTRRAVFKVPSRAFAFTMRRSFEAFGIGWSYWSYHDPFTVFLPAERVFGASPDAKTATSWFDFDLLKTVLD